MARWDDWLRIRHSDPDTPPSNYQQSLARKVLGELMERLARGQLMQGKLRREFPDGTTVIAQFDGTTPIVEVIDPVNPQPPKPNQCRCLQGRIGAATPVAYGRNLAATVNIPFAFEDDIYLLAGTVLTRYNPATAAFDVLPGNYVPPATVPTLQGGVGIPNLDISKPAFAYRTGTGAIRFIVQCLNVRAWFVEFEVGVGAVEAYQADNSLIDSLYGPIVNPVAHAPSFMSAAAIDNRTPGVWKQMPKVAACMIGTTTGIDYVTTYDYLARKFGKAVAVNLTAYNHTPGALGLDATNVYLINWLDANLVARPLWMRVPLDGSAPSARIDLPFAQSPYSTCLTPQICTCVTCVGGIVDENASPSDTADIWMINLQTAQCLKVGVAPWSDYPLNSEFLSFALPSRGRALLFNATADYSNGPAVTINPSMSVLT